MAVEGGDGFEREPRAWNPGKIVFVCVPFGILLAEEVASDTAGPGMSTLSVSVLVAVPPSWNSSSSDLCLGILTTVTVEPSPGVVVALLPDIGLKSGSIAEL